MVPSPESRTVHLDEPPVRHKTWHQQLLCIRFLQFSAAGKPSAKALVAAVRGFLFRPHFLSYRAFQPYESTAHRGLMASE